MTKVVAVSIERTGNTHEPVLVAESLTKRYGERLVVDASDSRSARRDVWTPRANGAGKTTTISMVCGLLSRHSDRRRMTQIDGATARRMLGAPKGTAAERRARARSRSGLLGQRTTRTGHSA